jgi:hypothetical protein
MVYLNEDYLRPKSLTPTYPPYHQGEYLEEYFYSQYQNLENKPQREYIDIFWSNIFCNRVWAGQSYPDLQGLLNDTLKSDGKYFTVCQQDDGPFEDFPEDTMIFSAGGNRKKGNVIPIPLVCSSIPKETIPPKTNKYFASFVGSNTYWVRTDLSKAFRGKDDCLVKVGQWNINIEDEKFNNFLHVMSSSKFSLCPRGYGTTSFRLYESFQLGTVPVYISDDHALPWSDELDWEEFCVIIDDDNIGKTYNILKQISDERYDEMLKKGQNLYKEYFSLEGVFKNIIKRI